MSNNKTVGGSRAKEWWRHKTHGVFSSRPEQPEEVVMDSETEGSRDEIGSSSKVPAPFMKILNEAKPALLEIFMDTQVTDEDDSKTRRKYSIYFRRILGNMLIQPFDSDFYGFKYGPRQNQTSSGVSGIGGPTDELLHIPVITVAGSEPDEKLLLYAPAIDRNTNVGHPVAVPKSDGGSAWLACEDANVDGNWSNPDFHPIIFNSYGFVDRSAIVFPGVGNIVLPDFRAKSQPTESKEYEASALMKFAVDAMRYATQAPNPVDEQGNSVPTIPAPNPNEMNTAITMFNILISHYQSYTKSVMAKRLIEISGTVPNLKHQRQNISGRIRDVRIQLLSASRAGVDFINHSGPELRFMIFYLDTLIVVRQCLYVVACKLTADGPSLN